MKYLVCILAAALFCGCSLPLKDSSGLQVSTQKDIDNQQPIVDTVPFYVGLWKIIPQKTFELQPHRLPGKKKLTDDNFIQLLQKKAGSLSFRFTGNNLLFIQPNNLFSKKGKSTAFKLTLNSECDKQIVLSAETVRSNLKEKFPQGLYCVMILTRISDDVIIVETVSAASPGTTIKMSKRHVSPLYLERITN